MDNWYDYQDNDVNEFIKNYRNSLKAQRDSNLKKLQQQRKNYMSTIMGSANRRGMMYSNFPQRDKINYDIGSYAPAVAATQTSYQTGLDTLRNNAVTLWNKIKSYNEQISDLNNYGTSGGGGSSTSSGSDLSNALLYYMLQQQQQAGDNSNNGSAAKNGLTDSDKASASAGQTKGMTVWDWAGGLANPLIYLTGKMTGLF